MTASFCTEDFSFMAAGHCLQATVIGPAAHSRPSILAFHGLGPTATRHRIAYLLGDLANQGFASLTFDFSGNGESSGALKECTLSRRRLEALEATRHLQTTAPPILIGTSMGAHIACWIAPEVQPRTLVLFCPATYPAAASNVPFDGTLARPADYADSYAYNGIEQFRGDLLIIAAFNDTVIPREVVAGYFRNATRARSKQLLWLDSANHFVHRWLPMDGNYPKVFRAILKVVASENHQFSESESSC